MPTVDPRGRQAGRLRGHVIVEEGLRDVQEPAGRAHAVGASKQGREVRRIGLVGADVLRGEDLVELDPESAVAAREASTVDVGEDDEPVPPLQAQLKSRGGQVVYSWTIAPPARSLPPGASASFNSAEVNVPPGGDELTISLGAPKA